MHDSNDKQKGIFYPREIKEMAAELKRREFPGGSKDDREEMAAAIVRRRQREHQQASRQSDKPPKA